MSSSSRKLSQSITAKSRGEAESRSHDADAAFNEAQAIVSRRPDPKPSEGVLEIAFEPDGALDHAALTEAQHRAISDLINQLGGYTAVFHALAAAVRPGSNGTGVSPMTFAAHILPHALLPSKDAGGGERDDAVSYWRRPENRAEAEQLGFAEPPKDAGGVPEGWVLVPREPTPQMIHATWNDPIDREGKVESQNARNARIYRAMISSASPLGEGKQ